MDTTRIMNLFGLSVSLCIKDVIENRVSVEQIDHIIGGTYCRTPREWDHVIESYQEDYWKYDPHRAERILKNLIKLGRVTQLRVYGMRSSNLADGVWIPATHAALQTKFGQQSDSIMTLIQEGRVHV